MSSEQPPPKIDWGRTLGGALAAVSSAVLLSSLGAAGTIIGAAVGSLVVSIGTSLYAQGLVHSRRRIADQTAAIRRVGVAQAELRRANRRGRASRDAHLDHAAEELAEARVDLAVAGEQEPPWPQRLRALPWPRIGLVAGGLFLVALIVITAFELVAGRPVSDFTGGTSGPGTTFSRVGHGAPASTRPSPTSPAASPTPTASTATPSSAPTPSATPSVTTPSTPAVTPTLPRLTASASP